MVKVVAAPGELGGFGMGSKVDEMPLVDLWFWYRTHQEFKEIQENAAET